VPGGVCRRLRQPAWGASAAEHVSRLLCCAGEVLQVGTDLWHLPELLDLRESVCERIAWLFVWARKYYGGGRADAILASSCRPGLGSRAIERMWVWTVQFRDPALRLSRSPQPRAGSGTPDRKASRSVHGPHGDPSGLTGADVLNVLDVNLAGVVRTTTAFLPLLRRSADPALNHIHPFHPAAYAKDDLQRHIIRRSERPNMTQRPVDRGAKNRRSGVFGRWSCSAPMSRSAVGHLIS
jgi:hypothetical protein